MTDQRDDLHLSSDPNPRTPAPATASGAAVAEDELPPGNHALEVAARRGIGPLSPLGRHVWHGETRPCPSCGQLVCRDDDTCQDCGQELDEEMLDRMRACAGPWYVLEHVRPFPGVRFERLVRQIQRGVLTETSIVRGPTTDHQWQFAVETAGLARYFGRCWECYGEVTLEDLVCQTCLARQDGLRDGPIPPMRQPAAAATAPARAKAAPTTAGNGRGAGESPVGQSAAGASAVGEYALKPSKHVQDSAAGADQGRSPTPLAKSSPAAVAALNGGDALSELSAAIDQSDDELDGYIDDTPRIAGIRATWVVTFVMVIALAALLMLVKSRPFARPGASSPAETVPAAGARP